MPRGGARPGAGRKPKPTHLRGLDGGAGHRQVVPPAAATAPIDEFDAPDTLSVDERNVWVRQAPLAFKARTLTRSTALAFERYCQLVVRERNEAKSSGCDGPNHARMIRTLNTLELQFQLTPCGKPIYEAEAQPAQPKKTAGYW